MRKFEALPHTTWMSIVASRTATELLVRRSTAQTRSVEEHPGLPVRGSTDWHPVGVGMVDDPSLNAALMTQVPNSAEGAWMAFMVGVAREGGLTSFQQYDDEYVAVRISFPT